jgi:DNA-directed RNA polymerase specialized sigma24 family protein
VSSDSGNGEDADLIALRQASTRAETIARLRALVVGRLQPVVRQVVDRRMRDQRDRQESADLCQDVLLQLLSTLERVRAGEMAPPISDIAAYAAVTADRTCSAHFRRKFPERSRLKSRARYVLIRHEAFLLMNRRGEWMCALAAWPSAQKASGALRDLRVGSRANAVAAIGGDAPASLSLAELLARLLHFAGGPVELDDVVSALVLLLGVNDLPPVPSPIGDDEGWLESLADGTRPWPDRLDDRAFLADVWAQVRELPVRQRAALLLNLRDGEGREMTSLLPLVGIATPEEIAACLEMSAAQLTAVWTRLPLDDLAIAAQFGITRQQVINLRKSARDRLARRLRRWRA